MSETFTSVNDPRDATYAVQRQQQIDELLKMSSQQLDRRLNWQLNSNTKIEDASGISQKYLGDITNNPSTPLSLRKSILDSTGGYSTGGSVLIRQDLEPTLLESRAFSR